MTMTTFLRLIHQIGFTIHKIYENIKVKRKKATMKKIE